MEKPYTIVVNEHHEFQQLPTDISQMDILKTQQDKFHFLREGKSYHIEVQQRSLNTLQYTLKINGTEYTAKIKTPLLQLIDSMGFVTQNAKNIASIEAPMPGLILEIAVQEGQEVRENEPLLILEAMKMENSITSPRQGVIKSIEVKKGDAVDKKQLLLTFE